MFPITRSFCLVALIGFGMLTVDSTIVAQQSAAMNSMVLNVKNMCSAKESVPAIKEMPKLAGVKRISCDYKTKTVKIEYTDAVSSPKAIWEAAERITTAPVRLATPQVVCTAKPVN